MEVKVPSRPLDLNALRAKLLTAGLIQGVVVAEGASSTTDAIGRGSPRKRCRRKTEPIGARVITDFLAGRSTHVFQLMCCVPFANLPSDFGFYFSRVRRLLSVHGLEKARSFCASSVHVDQRRNRPKPLFPCGIPYPEVYLRAHVPVSGRRRGRFCRERSVRMTLNQMVMYATWLAVGRSCGDQSVAQSVCPLSDLQWKLVGQIRCDLLRVCRPEDVISLEGCGHEKLEKTLRNLEEQKPYRLYSVHGDVCSVDDVVPLSSANMALPIRAAEIELTYPNVPRVFERILSTPRIFDLPSDRLPMSLPRFHMSVDDWPQVAQRLWESGLICLRPCDGVSVSQRAGLFGVPKKGSDQIRMICDRRQRNAVEKSMFEVLADLAEREGWDMA
eukprot:500552-Amphidinium_carterae.1